MYQVCQSVYQGEAEGSKDSVVFKMEHGTLFPGHMLIGTAVTKYGGYLSMEY